METGRESVRARAFAKINLGLEVLGTRADGYHLLRTGMQSISLADELLLTRTAEEGITLRCDEPSLPTDGRNLAFRAAEAVFRHCGLSGGVRIELKKQIPAEAGLGGGSADAAAVLRGLRALFALPLDDEALRELALPLGADVPFCVGGGTMLAEGIGEALSPLPPMPPCHLVIVKPPCGSSTKAVYAALSLKVLRPWEQPDARLLENALRGQNVTLLGAAERARKAGDGVAARPPRLPAVSHGERRRGRCDERQRLSFLCGVPGGRAGQGGTVHRYR